MNNMNEWLKLSEKKRIDILNQVNSQTGLPIDAIEKDWWVTGAWRYQLKGGNCMGGGEAECSNARVWDSHTVNEFILKVGFPLN